MCAMHASRVLNEREQCSQRKRVSGATGVVGGDAAALPAPGSGGAAAAAGFATATAALGAELAAGDTTAIGPGTAPARSLASSACFASTWSLTASSDLKRRTQNAHAYSCNRAGVARSKPHDVADEADVSDSAGTTR